MNNITDKLNKLAELRIAEREIKSKIEEILPSITEEIVDLDSGTALEVSAGTFTVSKRRTYKYSKAVEEKERIYKEAKKQEERTGKAPYTESTSIIFKENK